LPALARHVTGLGDVAVVRSYEFLCAESGQRLIREDISSLALGRVVVAACSPFLHEATFRNACGAAGLNPFNLQIANVREQVAWIPGAEAFLAGLKALGKRRVLVTNAHPETLAIKDSHVDLVGHLEAVYSTHPFGVPKEDPAFWPRLQAAAPFDPARTLFVDDSLPVLGAAAGYGIGWLRAIRRLD
ncbi:MAG: HAD-IA family hydrolase, partial [Deltaproteobacteria bacterium]